MKTSDLLQEAGVALSSNKARSGLTVLGIVIGIASVIAMIAVGQGASMDIQNRIESLGSNLLTVTPGFGGGGFGGARSSRGSATTLTVEDALAIADEVAGVAAVAPELSGRYQIVYKSQNTNTSVIGTVETYPQVRSIALSSGAFISSRDYESGAKVAVLGPTTRDDLFGEGVDPVGETIKINRISFKVIGVMEVKGGTGFTNQDDQVYIPLSTAQRVLAGSEHVSSIGVQAADKDSMTFVQNGITQTLLSRHNIADPASADFSVINQADIVSTATEATDTFTTLLAAIAAISLIVGGIGIMNMMLTSVTERTREIGLRKAIGAKGRDVTMQFLLEAVMLTMVGGSIGVLVGIGIAVGISRFTATSTDISLGSIALAFGVSTAIGIVFGYYPATKAAKLKPIEALRYE